MKYPNDFINNNIVGDSVELMKSIPENSIDLTVTSPPYDCLRTYKGKIKDGVVYEGGYSFPFQEMAKELYRITKKGGIVVWVVNDQVKNGGETGTSFRMALYFQEIGFKIYDTMIYHKNGPPFPEVGRYSQVFEYMFVFSKGKPNTVNLIKDKENRWSGHKNFGTPSARKQDGDLKKSEAFTVAEYGTRYNVWYINNGKGYTTKDDYAFEHPAMFPEELAEDHILSWTNEGDIVLDPMCGAGTTQKMSKLNNRQFIGIDLNQEYIDISDKRVDIEPYTEDNPNPKVKFIKSRDEILASRKKTREENKKKKLITGITVEEQEKRAHKIYEEEVKPQMEEYERRKKEGILKHQEDSSGLYEASGLKEIFENADKELEEKKKKEQEEFWDDIDNPPKPNEALKKAAKKYKEIKEEKKDDIDDFWLS